MIITEHRTWIGVDQDGQWRQRVNGKWIPIDEPEWHKKNEKKITDLHMKPPEGHQVEMVVVFRTVYKTVPDYEAEVLCRNGWHQYTIPYNDPAKVS